MAATSPDRVTPGPSVAPLPSDDGAHDGTASDAGDSSPVGPHSPLVLGDGSASATVPSAPARKSAGYGSVGSSPVLTASTDDGWLCVVHGGKSKLTRGSAGEVLQAVRLTPHSLEWRPAAEAPWTSVALQDLVGVELMMGGGGHAPSLILHTYVLESGCCKTPKRVHKPSQLQVGGTWTEAGQAVASAWHKAVMQLLRGHHVDATAPVPPRRRLLVLINPVSGPGHAERDYRAKAHPLLAHAGMDIEVVVTTHAGHATELAQRLDLAAYDGLASAGGDGLLVEVVQGLLRRSDWQVALQLPVAALPGGSGNGLVASMCHIAGEPYSWESMAFIIAQWRTMKLDLASAVSEGQRYLSFLLVCWAMVSDIDIESERWRCVGGARFTMQGVIRALALRHYRGRLHYLPIDHPSSVAAGVASTHTVAHAGEVAIDIDSGTGAGVAESKAVDTDATGEGDESKGESKGEGTGESKGDGDSSSEALRFGPPFRLLPAADPEGPLPPGWKTIEGEFSIFNAANTPFVSYDSRVAPYAEVDDGLFHVSYAQRIGRCRATQILLGLETEDFWNNSAVHTFSCRAFRLEPERRADGAGFVDMDGEVLPYAPISVEVHPRLLTTFGFRGTA